MNELRGRGGNVTAPHAEKKEKGFQVNDSDFIKYKCTLD